MFVFSGKSWVISKGQIEVKHRSNLKRKCIFKLLKILLVSYLEKQLISHPSRSIREISNHLVSLIANK